MILGIIASSFKKAVAYIARDTWARTLSNDWGTADIGGTWVYWGSGSFMYVNQGTASMQLSSALQRMVTLPVSKTAVLMRTWFSWNGIYGDAVMHNTVIGRLVPGGSQTTYQARVRIESGNVIRLRIQRDETELGGSSYVHPNAYTANTKMYLVLEVSGTNPTLIRAKFWLDGETEPTSWTLSATDSTSTGQGAGDIGLRGNLTTSAAGNSRTVTWGPLEVTAP